MITGLQSWAWLAIGLSLLFIEVVMTHFVLLFFGLAALLVSSTTIIGLTTGAEAQLVLFSVSALAMLLLLRRALMVRFAAIHPGAPPDYAGKIAWAETDITPLGGYASYRGSQWMAYRVDGTETIKAGSYLDIVGSDGVRLKVRPHVEEERISTSTIKEEEQ